MSNKNQWFKHYNNASEGASCQALIADKDFETLYIYWWLLEQISKLETYETRGKVTLNFSYFKMKLGLNLQRTTRVLLKIGKTFELKVVINLDQTVEVSSPKWLKLQENRNPKNSHNLPAFLETGEKWGVDLRLKTKDIRQREKEADFFEILNPTEIQHISLTKVLELEKIEKFLSHPNAFGNFVPALFHKASKSKMLAILVSVYENPELFRNDLNAILAEKNTVEKDEFSKSDYIATRVKNKALELYNATR